LAQRGKQFSSPTFSTYFKLDDADYSSIYVLVLELAVTQAGETTHSYKYIYTCI